MGELVSLSAVAVAAVTPPRVNRTFPVHLEDIVAGSYPSLGSEGQARLQTILHQYAHVFPARLRTEQTCIREMLEGGQIEPSDSPWASPVVLVTKKGWVYLCLC